jgi:hypothetical protein
MDDCATLARMYVILACVVRASQYLARSMPWPPCLQTAMVKFPCHILHTALLWFPVPVIARYSFQSPGFFVFPPPLPLPLFALKAGYALNHGLHATVTTACREEKEIMRSTGKGASLVRCLVCLVLWTWSVRTRSPLSIRPLPLESTCVTTSR